MKKTVEFLRAYSPYGIGDVAGFSPDKAEALVRAGFAKPVGVVTEGLPLTESAGETEIGREMNKKSPNSKFAANRAVSTEEGGDSAPEAKERPSKADKGGKKGSKPAPSKRRARNRIMDTE